ncbi:MAG: hypothetical protein ACI9QD_000077, partial [Thermoproteota archaeon]
DVFEYLVVKYNLKFTDKMKKVLRFLNKKSSVKASKLLKKLKILTP